MVSQATMEEAAIEKIEIPKENIQKYKKDKAFDYEIKQEEDNFIVKIYNWLKRKIKAFLYRLLTWLLGAKKAGKVLGFILKLLPYFAVLLFTYSIFRFLIGADLIRLRRNKNMKMNQVSFTDDEKILQEEDIDNLISEAIQQHNYRLAIRYYYLKTLKELIAAGLVDWQPEKTNRDYLREMNNESMKNKFNKLTFIYDYIWYGNHDLVAEDFKEFEQSFKDFQIG